MFANYQSSVSAPQAAQTSASSSPWYDSNRLQQLLANAQPGADGRRVLNHGELLSILSPQSGIMQMNEAGSQHAAGAGGDADSGLPDVAFGATFKGPDGQLYHDAGRDENGNQLIQWSDNGGDGWQNPTGGAHDRVAPIYRLDANGNATPIATNESYNPSGWVDYGRNIAEIAAVLGTAGYGGAALEAAGAAGGGAGAAGAGGASGATNAALIDSYLGTAGYGASSGVAGVGAGTGSAAYGATALGQGYAYPGELVASSQGGLSGALGEGGATVGSGSTAEGGAALGDYGAGLTGPGAAGTSLTTAAGVPGYTVGAAGDALGGVSSAAAGSGGGGSGFWSALGNGQWGDAASAAGDFATSQRGIGAIGSIANGFIGSAAASRASSALTNATNSSNALQQNIYNQNRSDWAPYRALGTQAVGQYQNLLAHPNSVLRDPGVAFQQQQGQQALDRTAGARGGLYSGAQLRANDRYNQDFASTALDRALSRYGSAAQIGATGTQGSQAGGTNYANQVGANTTGLGNALGGASLYQGSIWGNSLNQGIAQLNNSTYGQPRG